MLILFYLLRDRAVFTHKQSKWILGVPCCIKPRHGWLLCVATGPFVFAFSLHHLWAQRPTRTTCFRDPIVSPLPPSLGMERVRQDWGKWALVKFTMCIILLMRMMKWFSNSLLVFLIPPLWSSGKEVSNSNFFSSHIHREDNIST